MIKTIGKLISFIALLAVLLLPVTAGAQHGYDRGMFAFGHLGTDEGLASQRIYSILEGADGAMWFSSKNGVDRYNGWQVKNYELKTSRQFSGAGGRNTVVFKDGQQRIRAFDNTGNVFMYNPLTDGFVGSYSIDTLLQGDIILNDVYIDGKGNSWLGLNSGLYLLKPGGKLRQVTGNVFVNHLCRINNQLVVSTTSGVLLVDMGKVSVSRLVGQLNVQTSCYDALTGYLWLGTFQNGVKVMDMRSRRFLHLPELSAVPHTPVRAIEPMNRHTMLFGIDGSGVYVSDRGGRGVRLLFSADDQTGGVLHGNGVYTICKDRSGNIWIGSYSGGVDIVYPMEHAVEVYRHEYLNAQSLMNNSVNDVLQTADGVIWFATDRGVSIYDVHRMRWHHALANKVVLTLCAVQGGVLAGTYGDGVHAVGADGSSRELYTVQSGHLKTDYVYSLWTDPGQTLWIGCLNGDLVQLENGLKRYYPIQQVQCIADMPDGRLAVGTTDGIYAVDKGEGTVERYFLASEFPGKDINSYIQSILFTGRHTAWLATDGGGIYIYDLKRRNLRSLSMADGLPSNTVYALVRDSRGRIFASTDMGLAMIISKQQPEVVNISFVRGLEREYKRMSSCSLSDGRFVFGSSSGAVVINPHKLDRLRYQSHLSLTRLTLVGHEMTDSLRASLSRMLAGGEICLANNQNTFEIDFECINYKYQHDIVYQYMLEGFDRQWSSASPAQYVRYTNLPAGDYLLHVRSISRNDGHVMDSKTVSICVAQPWWNTWLAWVFYISALLMAAYGVWRTYLNFLERKYFDEKINFFIHTAHDIRTPLSLVLAPLKDIADDATLSPAARNYLNIARRNGDKLLRMITRLLDFQKADQLHGSMYVQQLDLKALLTMEAEKFGVLAGQKNISLSITSCPDNQAVWMDEDMADKIFENLLSNSIKYTPEGGKITLEAWADEKHAYIRVADNGIGIRRKAQKNIFQNFYRADNAVNSNETGSGLGLMLTRRLVKLHHGDISFESEEGQGTAFLIKLKLGHSHLTVGHGRSENRMAGSVLSLPSKITSGGDAKAAGSRAKDTMLFVDDNDELRRYMELTFVHQYNVVTKASAKEALEYLQGGLCDIVVSDVMMPGMSGEEFCRVLKQNTATSWLPVILLTAKSGRDFVIEGLEQGADDYITKPFDVEILKSKIGSLLENRRRLSKYYLARAMETARRAGDAPGAQAEDDGRESGVELNTEDKAFLDKAARIVLENIKDTDFNIDRLCYEMAMSRTLFYGRLKALTSQTPQDFIRLIRLEQAAALLKQGKQVIDVAVITGFVSPKHFSTVFKKHFGVAPSKYRDKA